ncbi:hypothetical protein OGAPHI_004613 [Ogataea philodendri]|uniref:C2H2-type domain-containing protein n=1 Tax=Ogataea philodendri TaxID=1378263 RepID=A0A9P8T326_9ASCO|nr:uncharacterized protein OGAPHI_004613 [Ogataea philodendri]KAH3664261.1 hypothetical protein OGAPHI_004613 [Ogataea philodendri]
MNNPFVDTQQGLSANFKTIPLPEDNFGFDPVAYDENENFDSILFDLGISEGYSQQPSQQQPNFEKKHTRQTSGSGIFGYVGTGTDTQLAIPGLPVIDIKNKKPIYQPIERYTEDYSYVPRASSSSNAGAKPAPDYIVTGQSQGYKFPPGPEPKPPTSSNYSSDYSQSVTTSYSAQELIDLRQLQEVKEPKAKTPQCTPIKVKHTFVDVKTPTPQKIPAHFNWTPTLITKKNSLSEQIIQEQRKSPTKKKKPTITSTLERGALDVHFVGPDDKDMYKCIYNDCGKLFTRVSNIRAHIQTHLSDRPFTCDTCGKAFVRNHDLRRHYKGHQEFQHVCPCGKKFPRQDALKRHRIRNICVGGLPDEKGVFKKTTSHVTEVKRGRPRKVNETTEGKILKDLSTPQFQPYMDTSPSISPELAPGDTLEIGFKDSYKDPFYYESNEFAPNIEPEFSFSVDDYEFGRGV